MPGKSTTGSLKGLGVFPCSKARSEQVARTSACHFRQQKNNNVIFLFCSKREEKRVFNFSSFLNSSYQDVPGRTKRSRYFQNTCVHRITGATPNCISIFFFLYSKTIVKSTPYKKKKKKKWGTKIHLISENKISTPFTPLGGD